MVVGHVLILFNTTPFALQTTISSILIKPGKKTLSMSNAFDIKKTSEESQDTFS